MEESRRARTEKSTHFITIEELKEKAKQELLAKPKSVFQKDFEDWEIRWHKFIISEGNSFEGDKIVIDI